jgi:putative ABC transport system permease protein
VAMILGIVGVYGVMSYLVGQRTPEIGVRMALGAAPAGIARMIAAHGAMVAGAGLAGGVILTLLAGQSIQGLLYGVSGRDPIVLASTALAVLGVVLIACWVPARRAAGIDPSVALRST